ncbi:hypothetical protein ACIA5D_01030 [Actinoplanes sp. NPDC051513]|uniref:hypothetical protein n=1 Tax=Actinoplanes sp. NPDC051513 TaxID=3363908 RepID=UPI0037A3CEC9
MSTICELVCDTPVGDCSPAYAALKLIVAPPAGSVTAPVSGFQTSRTSLSTVATRVPLMKIE